MNIDVERRIGSLRDINLKDFRKVPETVVRLGCAAAIVYAGYLALEQGVRSASANGPDLTGTTPTVGFSPTPEKYNPTVTPTTTITALPALSPTRSNTLTPDNRITQTVTPTGITMPKIADAQATLAASELELAKRKQKIQDENEQAKIWAKVTEVARQIEALGITPTLTSTPTKTPTPLETPTKTATPTPFDATATAESRRLDSLGKVSGNY